LGEKIASMKLAEALRILSTFYCVAQFASLKGNSKVIIDLSSAQSRNNGSKRELNKKSTTSTTAF